MKQNKSVQIIFLSLILSCLFLSGEVFAYKESDLKKLRDTNRCQSCDLRDANLRGANLRGAYLSGTDLRGANLMQCQLCDLRDANLSGTDLRGANLYGTDLRGANLRGANLSGAKLKRANLSDANLSGANLSGAYLSGTALIGANLKNANLKIANLKIADLRNANLTDTNLINADLSHASLNGANLSGANLSGANLSWANLSGANLSGANLKRANLTKLNLKGAHPETHVKNLIKKRERKERLDLPKNELGLFYKSYAILKQCYEARKGYQVVHVNPVEMRNIKSWAKSIEKGIFKKFPKVKSMKDQIWNKFTKVIEGLDGYTCNIYGELYCVSFHGGIPVITSDFSEWDWVCKRHKPIFNKLIKTYGGGGGKIEKDF